MTNYFHSFEVIQFLDHHSPPKHFKQRAAAQRAWHYEMRLIDFFWRYTATTIQWFFQHLVWKRGVPSKKTKEDECAPIELNYKQQNRRTCISHSSDSLFQSSAAFKCRPHCTKKTGNDIIERTPADPRDCVSRLLKYKIICA